MTLRGRFGLCCLAAWLSLWLAQAARAGGGPENVFLLVNERSAGSRTIANHYVALRKLPPNHVLYLDWQGSVEQTDIATFREKILQPAIAAIRDRGLAEQIDYLIYSSDFPWLIDLKADFAAQKLPPQLAPAGSLTGVTYLWQLAAARNPNLINLRANLYVQRAASATVAPESHGFRSWYGWSDMGQPLEAGGSGYLLSTMLGVTSGRGNTVDEVIDYLTRSTEADGTRPAGTIYYMKNGNIRSTTRQAGFETAVNELRRIGVGAEIVSGEMPIDKRDVAGLMAGSSDFNWPATKSTIVPGAICEHLTSFGGVLHKNAGQTPLTEFLRHGAAGSAGTVTEPYAMQDKFPLPAMHVHYARGCTLAEAFYQSVAGPYQLLIVGDPLCRPWAEIPLILAEGVQAGETLRSEVQIRPQARTSAGSRVDRYELFVDGRRMAAAGAGQPLPLDTRTLSDGYHELRIVGICAGPIATQGRLVVPVQVRNGDDEISVQLTSPAEIAASDKIKLKVNSPGATAIAIMHNGRAVGRLAAEAGEITIAADQLGSGPVTLQAVSLGGRPLQSPPVRVTIRAAQ